MNKLRWATQAQSYVLARKSSLSNELDRPLGRPMTIKFARAKDEQKPLVRHVCSILLVLIAHSASARARANRRRARQQIKEPL